MTMNAMDELNSKLGDLMNRIKDFDPLKIDNIHTTYGSDHGKGKFRFVSKILVRLVKGTKFKLIYPLADILCCMSQWKNVNKHYYIEFERWNQQSRRIFC